MSTISGRHLEEPSTSKYVRHLQVFSIDIDIFGHFLSLTSSVGAWHLHFGSFFDIFCLGHHLRDPDVSCLFHRSLFIYIQVSLIGLFSCI